MLKSNNKRCVCSFFYNTKQLIYNRLFKCNKSQKYKQYEILFSFLSVF